MRKLILFACFVTVAGFLAGCSNTLDGAGKDIERAGEKIQDTF